MPIEKANIERVKQSTDLATFIRSRGIALKKKGKQLVGRCPFHDDHTPSLIVDPTKQLWNCLGACNEGGDIYKFVMKSDSVDFREAHKRLTMSDEGEPMNEAKKAVVDKPSVSVMDAEALAWLERVVAHYHRTLLETPAAQDYLCSRGLQSPEVITTFRLGLADGSLLKILSDDGRAQLKKIGILNDDGRELMAGCVVFPLVNADTNQVVNLYGRHTTRRQHLYLPGERRGIFNPTAAKQTDEVIIAESIIDAAALWSTGLRHVIPTYGTTGLTDEIVSHLVNHRVTRAVLMMDTDDAGRRATEEMRARLAAVNIAARSVELPAKDASQFIASGGTLEQLQSLITPAPPSATLTPILEMERSDDGIITFKLNERVLVQIGVTGDAEAQTGFDLHHAANTASHICDALPPL